MIREFLCTDVECIESVGAVGAVFEQVFFGLRKILAWLVFAVIAKRFQRKNPLRPRLPPADCMARIKFSLFERLKNGTRRCLPAKPWLMSRYFSLCRIGIPRYTASTCPPCAQTHELPTNGNPVRWRHSLSRERLRRSNRPQSCFDAPRNNGRSLRRVPGFYAQTWRRKIWWYRAVRFTGASPCDDNGSIRADKLR